LREDYNAKLMAQDELLKVSNAEASNCSEKSASDQQVVK
jgi:hypothetical protein